MWRNLVGCSNLWEAMSSHMTWNAFLLLVIEHTLLVCPRPQPLLESIWSTSGWIPWVPLKPYCWHVMEMFEWAILLAQVTCGWNCMNKGNASSIPILHGFYQWMLVSKTDCGLEKARFWFSFWDRQMGHTFMIAFVTVLDICCCDKIPDGCKKGRKIVHYHQHYFIIIWFLSQGFSVWPWPS